MISTSVDSGRIGKEPLTSSRHLLARASCLATILLVIGCSLDVTRSEPILWEGELQSTGATPELNGLVAAISRDRSTETSIQVTGGEDGDRWIWRLRHGTCEDPGEVVGAPAAFPVLEATAETEPDLPGSIVKATGETVLAEVLGSSGDYHASVAGEDATETILACGALTR